MLPDGHERLSPVPSKYMLPPLVEVLYGAVIENGLNVPWVVLPLRVMVKLLVLASRNVLFCAAFVPLPGSSMVTYDQKASLTAAATAPGLRCK